MMREKTAEPEDKCLTEVTISGLEESMAFSYALSQRRSPRVGLLGNFDLQGPVLGPWPSCLRREEERGDTK